MTSNHIATTRAINLLRPFCELRSALQARFDCFMPCIFMILDIRTRTTKNAFSSSLCPAVRAMFWKTRRRSELSTVNFLMASKADCNSVGNVKSKVRELCKLFYMMGVEFTTFISALLTGIIISMINSLSPLFQFASHLSAFTVQRCSAFPCGSKLSHRIRNFAGKRTILRAFIYCVIFFITPYAGLYIWNSSFRPADFGTIMGSFSAVCLYFVLVATFRAIVYNLCIFHNIYYSIFSPAYVAVALQRFLDHTGITPVLIEAE